MEEIEKNGYNLNISRYVSTAPEEEIVDIEEVRQELEKIENDINVAKARHNEFLKELGLNLLPVSYTHLSKVCRRLFRKLSTG